MTVGVVAVVVLAPDLASAESFKAKGLMQVDLGEERAKMDVGTKK